MQNITLKNIEEAKNRIDPHIINTPIFYSETLNSFLGHKIYFKTECLQKIGAFKVRGGLNTVAWLIENMNKPAHIVANSSGNHAQAVALASKIFNIPATIYMPENVSKVKAQATLAYGAHIDYSENRIIADKKVKEASHEKGVYWIPPYNHEQVIAGQGTAAYEAIKEVDDLDAIFAPCGGGGLLSGSLIAAREMAPKVKVMGIEPKNANDAISSIKIGTIQKLVSPPSTIADGAKTMSVGDITFKYLKQLDDFFEAEEKEIIYWTQWLTHLLKIQIEPTSSMAMVGVVKWLKYQKTRMNVLVILSGGNIDMATMNKIWENDYLTELPSLVL